MLTSSPTDVLSHVAIRARAQNVLLASCFAPEELQAMEGLEGRHVSLSIDALGTVSAAESEAAAESSQAGEHAVPSIVTAVGPCLPGEGGWGYLAVAVPGEWQCHWVMDRCCKLCPSA